MKNIFIGLLTSINLLIVSCLGLGDSQKCDKFVEDYHNPAGDKYEEFAKKLKSYDDSQPIKDMKSSVWGGYGYGKELSFDTGLDVDDINGLKDNKFYGHKTDFNNSKKNFDAVIKLGDESIEAFKKIIDNDSEVCKNKHPNSNTYLGLSASAPMFITRPGESDYKTKAEKIKKNIEKVMEINKAFRAKAETALGL